MSQREQQFWTAMAGMTVSLAAITAQASTAPCQPAPVDPGETHRLSEIAADVPFNDDNRRPWLSGDGAWVTYESIASNIPATTTVGDDFVANGWRQLFVQSVALHHHNLLVSVSSTGEAANADVQNQEGSISRDGAIVVFSTEAANLVGHDSVGNPNDGNAVADVFAHFVQGAFGFPSGTTLRVSRAHGSLRPRYDDGGLDADGKSDGASISKDGRFVVFSSLATNLVIDDTQGFRQAYVHDLLTGRTELVSKNSDGEVANGHVATAAINANGSVVAFPSIADNLVDEAQVAPHDTNGITDIFVHDRSTSRTRRVSVRSGGQQALRDDDSVWSRDGNWLNNGSFSPTLSDDGRSVVFDSRRQLLTDDVDGNDSWDVFLHVVGQDETDSRTVLISAVDGVAGNGMSAAPSMNADGTRVVFTSTADDLDPDAKAPAGYGGVFVVDVDGGQAGRPRLVSVNSAGEGANRSAGNDMPGLDDDGRLLVFDSAAANLVASSTAREGAPQGRAHAHTFLRLSDDGRAVRGGR